MPAPKDKSYNGDVTNRKTRGYKEGETEDHTGDWTIDTRMHKNAERIPKCHLLGLSRNYAIVLGTDTY